MSSSSINNFFSVCRAVPDKTANMPRWSSDRQYILIELAEPQLYQQAVRTAKEILVKANAPIDKGLVVYNNATGTSTMVYRDGPRKIQHSHWDGHVYRRYGRMNRVTGVSSPAQLPGYLNDHIW